jgi:hypothetical protein
VASSLTEFRERIFIGDFLECGWHQELFKVKTCKTIVKLKLVDIKIGSNSKVA